MKFKILGTFNLLISLGMTTQCLPLNGEEFAKLTAIKAVAYFPIYSASRILTHELGHACASTALYNTPSHIALGTSGLLIYSNKYISIFLRGGIIPIINGVGGCYLTREYTSKGLRGECIREVKTPRHGYKRAMVYAAGPTVNLLNAAGLAYASHAFIHNSNSDNLENNLSWGFTLGMYAAMEAATCFDNLIPKVDSFRSLNDGAGILLALKTFRSLKMLWAGSMRTASILVPSMIFGNMIYEIESAK
jgi:hypothetical protein